MTGNQPKRIQLSRRKGWRLPEGAVSVARPTRWGNPYTVPMMRARLDELAADDLDISGLDPRSMAVEAFRSDLQFGPDSQWWWYGPHMQIIGIKGGLQSGELAGKHLACWCPLPEPGQPDICHGAVLLQLSNPAVQL